MLRKVAGLVVLLAALLSGSAAAQDCNGCGIGYWYKGVPATGGTFTGAILLSDGTNTAPAIAFSADADGTGTGFYRVAANLIGVAANGAATAYFRTGALFDLPADTAAIRLGTSADVTLYREAAAVLQVGTDAATAAAQTIVAADSTGASQPGGQLNLSGGTGGAGGEPGAVALVDGGTKPTCAAGIRGSLWYDAGGAGVADTLEVCRKDASNNYAWAGLF